MEVEVMLQQLEAMVALVVVAVLLYLEVLAQREKVMREVLVHL